MVTAGHCTTDRTPSGIKIIAGTISRTAPGALYPVETILRHPDFNVVTQVNDISLLKTVTEIIFGASIAPIPMSTTVTGDNVLATISGWGLTSVKFKYPSLENPIHFRFPFRPSDRLLRLCNGFRPPP